MISLIFSLKSPEVRYEGSVRPRDRQRTLLFVVSSKSELATGFAAVFTLLRVHRTVDSTFHFHQSTVFGALSMVESPMEYVTKLEVCCRVEAINRKRTAFSFESVVEPIG